jgi:uncharacterized protein YkwD
MLEDKNKINIVKKMALAIASFGISFIAVVTPTYATQISEAKLVELLNTERTNHELKTLTIDPSLYFAALTKAQDMLKKGYFEHFTPDNKSPWTFIKNAGYYYTKAGENLAMDFRTSEGVNNAWLASPAHKQNMLDPDFENVGLATLKGNFNGHETIMIVEMFGKKDQSFLSPVNSLISTVTNYIIGF